MSRYFNPVAIVQARLTSTRFPGKVLKEVKDGVTVLDCVVNRLKSSDLADVIVAIPDNDENHELRLYCTERGWKYWEGPEEDVLYRYLGAAHHYKADPVVRVTSDCPLVDPVIVNTMLHQWQVAQRQFSGGCDLLANNLQYTFPHGLDVEMISMKALARSGKKSVDKFEREHVSEYIRRRTNEFSLINFGFDLNNLDKIERAFTFAARLVVDHPEDLEFMRALFALFQEGHHPLHKGVLKAIVEHPEIVRINQERHLQWLSDMGMLNDVARVAAGGAM